MPAPSVIKVPGSAGAPILPFDLARSATANKGFVNGAGPVQTTIRYVRKTGSDSNGGTSPSNAWLTIGKALTTASPGTIIYVGAGVYREVVTVTITPTTGLPVSVIGDVDGLFTGDAGVVQWTAYTTNDKTIPSSGNLITLSGKSNLTFKNISFIGGSGALINISNVVQNLSFLNCSFNMNIGASVVFATIQYGVYANWLFDNCIFCGTSPFFSITLNSGTSGDYNAGIVIRNSLVIQEGSATPYLLNLTKGLSASGLGGGAQILNCTLLGCGISTTNISTNYPVIIRGCIIINGSNNTALNASGAGQLIEDYNVIYAVIIRSNVIAGVHSISDRSYAPLFNFCQEYVWGGSLRELGEPSTNSPLLAFGTVDTSAGLLDVRSAPRPSIASKFDVGALQRGNNFVQEISAVHTGSNAISVVGDGFQDFDVEVDAGAITFSIYCQYDSNYQGPLPRFAVLSNGELGVGYTEVPFSTTSNGAFDVASITVNPTASGILTIRVISGDVSGIGKTTFDTFAVA